MTTRPAAIRSLLSLTYLALERAAAEARIEQIEQNNMPPNLHERQESPPNPAPVAVAPPVNIPHPKPQITQPTVLEFATKEQAEAAFIDLLQKTVSSRRPSITVVYLKCERAMINVYIFLGSQSKLDVGANHAIHYYTTCLSCVEDFG